MKKIRICQYCGKTFKFRYRESAHNRGKYCSKKCFYSSKQINSKCLFCEKSFLVAKSRARENRGKFCSKDCYLKYQRQNQKENKCIHCGKIYYTSINKKNSKYCSSKCQREDKGIEKICPVCKKPFRANFKKLNKGFDLYCSQKCHYADHNVTKKCPFCGKMFTRRKGLKRRFCSIECQHKGLIPWNKGKSGTYINSKRRARQIELGLAKMCLCKWCGNEFYNPIWRMKQNMMCCCYEHARLYAKNKNTIEISCRGCGKRFKVKLRKIKGIVKRTARSFCSDECRKNNYNAVEGFCANCGKKILIHRNLIKRNKHCFCGNKCRQKGLTLEANLYGKTGKHIISNTGHIIQATKEFYPERKGRKLRKYRPQHRILIGKYIGRPLKFNDEPVWHLNGIPTDNKMENLYVFESRSHQMRCLMRALPFPIKSNLEQLRRAASRSDGSVE